MLYIWTSKGINLDIKKKIMLDFASIIEKLKLENDDLVNFRVSFNHTTLFLEGEFIENGVNNGYYDAGTIAYFYIPTEKGYISSEWKKTNFYKNGLIEVTKEELNSLEPFLQTSRPKTWSPPMSVSAASVIATHSNQNLYSEYR